MKLQRMQIGEPFISTDELKQYLQYAGSNKDDELKSAIDAATTLFEDRRNISLRPMTIALVSKSNSAGLIQVYYPDISEIASVKSAEDKEMDFAFVKALDVVKVRPNIDCSVIYKTEACSNASVYKSAVMGMAALIFDGSTESEAYQTTMKWA